MSDYDETDEILGLLELRKKTPYIDKSGNGFVPNDIEDDMTYDEGLFEGFGVSDKLKEKLLDNYVTRFFEKIGKIACGHNQ